MTTETTETTGTADATDPYLRRALRDVADGLKVGRLPARVVSDPALHTIEMERIFGRAWVFLGHESELAKSGDFVVRHIGADSVIVCRDNSGRIQALSNSCRHRGALVCRAEMGNTAHFQCPYHGWVYSNTGELVGVPAMSEAYPGGFDKSQWGLRHIPHVDSYAGFIFGSVDPKAPSLTDYLGDTTFHLDLIAKKTAGGLEVIGAPHRWVMSANWKTAADNFVGDSYHTLFAHRSMVELGMAPGDPNFASAPAEISLQNGHGVGVLGFPPTLADFPEYEGYPGEVVDQMATSYPSPVHKDLMRRSSFIHGTVFPNLSFINVTLAQDHMSPPTPFITFRVWHPLSHDRMEILSWFLVERDAPEWLRDASQASYVNNFGPGGVFEQDDAEAWKAITESVQGPFAGEGLLNYEMGMDLTPLTDWPGPGEALPSGYAEQNQRRFWGRWLEYMGQPPAFGGRA
uniref:Dioxygenase large alpha subunit n=1 Tax=Mycolicibacterium pallens TaxID=370524 RepID=Q199A5_9MYCO|nr:dioxygenase large alpha subunit [Mycolicibacterium pallens]